MTDQPKLPLTVPPSLWEAMAGATYPAFADSYLSGATINGPTLRTKTNTARSRIMASSPALRVLTDFGLSLAPPSTPAGAYRAWSWPSDAEYESMSLPDKVWQRRKMAEHERGLAGPQTMEPAQMPQRWHDHLAKASNHMDEADRLTRLKDDFNQREGRA